ncbi:RNA polymerase sigma factor SigW [Pullulanibacillus sp. KACC 23026]|uniref:RNA polymerase sigma factor SigW n=1 Tax=Pullulanibacillus sp. KACC 23026 TaxID=3028315 RepID=UPI0023B1E26A|nr:RNA polymerase sigma factor SigW [Pullulanibacillus sp. KACC 23026]WEG12616.1 RNA polymerase sigma factor SigW [Pullulanibacillus sp. KACC 23026]
MNDDVREIIMDLRKGNQEAFRELVDLYKRQVYAICLRLVHLPTEAEDLAQEAFLRAYSNIDSYDIDKKFSTWLYRIATNISIDYLRKRRPSVYLDAEVPGTEGVTLQSQLSAEDLSPDEEAVKSEERQDLYNAIESLPVKYRSAIILKYVDDLSLNEISEILELPVATVKTHIHRGREALRKRLVKH